MEVYSWAIHLFINCELPWFVDCHDYRREILFISEAITSWFLKRLICHSRKRVTIFSAFFVKSTGWKCSQESLRCCARIVFYDKVDLTLGADAGLSPPLRMRNRTFYGISLGWPHPNLQCLLGLKKQQGLSLWFVFSCSSKNGQIVWENHGTSSPCWRILGSCWISLL